MKKLFWLKLVEKESHCSDAKPADQLKNQGCFKEAKEIPSEPSVPDGDILSAIDWRTGGVVCMG